MHAKFARIVAFSFALCAAPLAAQTGRAPSACVAESGTASPHLIELYTSEGCSSCPPAENWLSGLSNDANVIALEFHVDYWDALGWKDPFANARWTARQQALAARSLRHIVYTPEVALDGQEWQQWSHAALPAAAPSPLRLVLEVTPGAPLQAVLDTRETRGGAPLQAYFALVENGLSSAVRNGENAGRTLRHTNVVRAFAGPVAFGEQATLQAPTDLLATNAALVGFVTDAQGTVQAALRIALADCR